MSRRWATLATPLATLLATPLATLLALAAPGAATAHEALAPLLEAIERALGELDAQRFEPDVPRFELPPRFDLPFPGSPRLFSDPEPGLDPDLCLASGDCWRDPRFWRAEPCLAAPHLDACSQQGGLQLVPVLHPEQGRP